MKCSLIPFIVALFVFHSCAKDHSEPISQVVQLVEKSNYERLDPNKDIVDIDDVYILTNLVCQQSYLGTKSSELIIDSVEPISDNEGKPLMYVVNLGGEGGYYVFSARKTFFPVIAFSDQGHLDLSTIDSSGVGLLLRSCAECIQQSSVNGPIQGEASFWREFEKNELKSIPRTKSGEINQIISDTLTEWNALGYHYFPLSEILAHSDIPYEVAQRFISVAEREINSELEFDYMVNSFVLVEENYYLSTTGPFLTTTWGKFSPYNLSCPIVNNAHASVGCVAVATGQIMKYHQYPLTYSWSQMPDALSDTTNTETTLSIFLKEVADGVYANFSNGGASNIIFARSYLLNKGYTVSSVQTHNKSTVIYEIGQGRPVYQEGYRGDQSAPMGHAWVCDGYKSIYHTTDYQLMVIQEYPVEFACVDEYVSSSGAEFFHMNFGVSSDHVGWYYDSNNPSNLPVSPDTYSILRTDLYNIHP